MWKLIETVERLMKDYPDRSQENKKSAEVIISVKLFDIGSSIDWRLSEYDPKNRIAFGYVTGLYEDEWWSVSLEELESQRWQIKNRGRVEFIQRIEIDSSFKPTQFNQLPFNTDNSL